jgi:transcriptional regulator with XRE-family HTH domain
MSGSRARTERQELGDFLRGIRTHLDPADFGLSGEGRRRASGLRRSEVADLAGVSLTWYTWLEQGRDVHASSQVIDAIATALHMDPDRHGYLRHLAGLSDLSDEGLVLSQNVHAGARRLLIDLEPIPACVVDQRSFILDWNQGFRTLWGNPGSLPADERNVVWMFFTWPVYRHLRNYEAEARLVVARIRNFFGRSLDDVRMRDLVTRLADRSPEFRRLWDLNEVRREVSRTLVLDFDDASITFHLMYLSIVGQSKEYILVFQPMTPEDRERMAAPPLR